MRKVLLVQPSSSRLNNLVRILKTRGYHVEVAEDYRKGMAMVVDVDSSGSDLVSIIIGWPTKDNDRDFRALTNKLREHTLSHLAVLLMSETMSSPAVGWLKLRKRSALLLWSDYSEVPDALGRLLDPHRQRRVNVLEELADHHLRVLFVDDSPTVRIAFRRLLMKHGFLVETAATAAEGYARALESPYDIAIVDYFMPEQNGTALVSKLKANPNTSSIMSAIITGTYSDTVINDSLVCGAVECIFKSEAKELFLTRIASMARSIIDRKSIENERRRLEGILSSVGDGVYGVDGNGIIQFANPAALEILGFASEDQLVGSSAYDLFHSRHEDGSRMQRESCFLSQCYESGNQVSGWQTSFWSRSGRVLPVECTVFPLEINGSREGSVVAFRDVSARKILEEELRWQATHDSLTKLANRSHFEDELDQEVHRLKRGDQVSALLFLDLDRFKYINDTAGHVAGDRLLVEVASRLRKRLRMSDSLARIGGDEYAIILRNVRAESVVSTAEQFRQSLEDAPFVYEGKQYVISATVGLALMDRHTPAPGEAMANADIACHLAKAEGRNRVHLFSPESDERRAMDMELGWSSRLKQALRDDHFELFFQPIVQTGSIDFDKLAEDGRFAARTAKGAAREYEVLLRLRDPDGKLIAPDAFLPTAERFNLTAQIDHWVIDRAFQELAKVNAKDSAPVRISINLSEQSLIQPNTVSYIADRLRHYDIDGRNVTFELGETRAMSHMDAVTDMVRALRRLGCRFGLDDFGTGFASFSHLRRMEVDYLKIDGAYLRASSGDPINMAVLAAIAKIAHALGKRTIAECVETAEIVQALRKTGIDQLQGNFVSRPKSSLSPDNEPSKIASLDARRQRADGT